MVVLFVTLELPYPPHSGVAQHDFYLIQHTARQHTVIVLSLISEVEQVRYILELASYCAHVDIVWAKPRSFTEHIAKFQWGRPLATQPFVYTEMLSKIQQVITAWKVDVVQIEHSFLAPYVEAVPPPCKKVLSFHNVGVQQYRRMMGLRQNVTKQLGFLLKWGLMLGWEAKYAEKFDLALTVSEPERQLLLAQSSHLQVSVIENGVDTNRFQPLPLASEPVLIFAGTMGYPPNVDAMLYFCDEILPLIQRQFLEVKLLIVGHAPAPAICKLAERKNVIVTGAVPDLIPYYQQAQISIVPLRAGGGTRLKILEAMALGRPVVSTTIGCEGLAVNEGEHLFVADDPAHFAQRVGQLLTDKDLRHKIADQARRLVETRYDWSIIGEQLLKLYKTLTASEAI